MFTHYKRAPKARVRDAYRERAPKARASGFDIEILCNTQIASLPIGGSPNWAKYKFVLGRKGVTREPPTSIFLSD